MADHKNNKQDHEGATADERMTAVLALLADQEAPVGPTPTLMEIQDWHLGKLDENRAAEVKTHVARDPECYQIWSDLLAAEKESAPTRLQQVSLFKNILNKFTQWWTTPSQLWVSGGMVTAIVIVVAVVLIPQQGAWSPLDDPIHAELDYDWPYADLSVTRGGDLSYRQKVAMQAGLRVGIEITTQGKQGWNEAIYNLPNETLSCEKQADVKMCLRETELMKNAGTHAGVLYMACLDRAKGERAYFNEKYWQQMTKGWQSVAEELKGLKITPLQEKTYQIGSSNNKEQQCRLVRDVIFMSY